MKKRVFNNNFNALSKRFLDFSTKISKKQEEMSLTQRSMHNEHVKMKKRIQHNINNYSK